MQRALHGIHTWLRTAAALLGLVALTACGGGGYAEVSVDSGPPPVVQLAPLAISLTRVGPEAIEVDWSDDPAVHRFIVFRDGHTLADLNDTTLVDASVFVDERYCYQVSGYDRSGLVVAASDTACIVLLP